MLFFNTVFASHVSLFRNVSVGLTALGIIPFVFFSYILGHLISLVARRIETRLTGKKKSWMMALDNSPVKSQIIALAQEKHDLNLLENEQLSEKATGDFFDFAYFDLEKEGKHGKVSVLMSQYVFFRNAMGTLFLMMLTLLLAKVFMLSVLKVPFVKGWYPFIFLLICCWFCFVLMKKRKSVMMDVVYRSYYSLYK